MTETHVQTIVRGDVSLYYYRHCSCGYEGPPRLRLTEALDDTCPSLLSSSVPAWCVICDRVSDIPHVRDDGHDCENAIVAHPDMSRAQLKALRLRKP